MHTVGLFPEIEELERFQTANVTFIGIRAIQ